MFGRMYNKKVANRALLLLFVGFNMLYMPMFFLGFMGMPRRYYDYLPQFASLNLLSTVGSWILAISLVAVIVNLLRAKKIVTTDFDNPWMGRTLEWKIQSPPTLENFDEIPVVDYAPYEKTDN
jgi:cytochrome c oxidase subunit 1